MLALKLIKPRVISVKNRWFRPSSGSALSVPYKGPLVLILVSLACLGVYYCTYSALVDAERFTQTIKLKPETILNTFLSAIFLLLLLSSCVHAVGTMLVSKDLDQILSAPINKISIYIGKVIEVTFESSWMMLVFGVPSLIAFGQHNHANLSFYFLAFITLLPLLLIPNFLGVAIATFLSAIIPAKRMREATLFAALIFAYFVMSIWFEPKSRNPSSALEVIKSLDSFTTNQLAWLPSSLASTAIASTLQDNLADFCKYFALIYAIGAATFLLGWVTVRFCYSRALEMARASHGLLRLNSKRAQSLQRILFPFVSQSARSIAAKEYKIFSRDITQAVQMMLLLGICTVYLYNFRILRADQVAENIKVWWTAILSLCNMLLGLMIVLTVCARFVFPSVSAEGGSFWILKSSPITISSVLRIKFGVWAFPIAILAGVILAAGGCAIDAPPLLLACSTLFGMIQAIGMVGLSIGLGAVFANFEWEHIAQASTSVGSLLLMVMSALAVMLSLLPFAVIVFMFSLRETGIPIDNLSFLAAVLGSVALVVAVNFIMVALAIRAGSASLLRSI